MDSIRCRQIGRPRLTLGPQADEIGSKYSALADDTAQTEKSREAAMMMVTAEMHLVEQGDHEGAITSATRAFDIYKSLNDSIAEADSTRLIVHAHRLHADFILYEGGSAAENKAADLYDTTEKKIKAQLQHFKGTNDKRGQGAMTLSLAEVADDRRTKYEVDELREVLHLAQKAKVFFQEAGDKKMEAIALLLAANTHYKLHENDEAYMTTEAALMGFLSVGDKRCEAKALTMLAYAHILRNELDEGISVATDAISIFRQQGAKTLEAIATLFLAEHYIKARKGRNALPCTEDALELFREVDFCKGWQAQALDSMVQAFILRGEDRKALSIAKESLDSFRELGDKTQLVMALHSLLHVHLSRGDYAEALKLAEEEQGIVQDMGDPRWEAGILLDIATVQLQRSNLDLAIDATTEALEMHRGIKDRQGEAFAMNKLNEINLAKGDDDAVMQTTAEQRAIFQELDDRSRSAACQLTLAGLTAVEGKYEEAASMAEEGLELFQEAKDKEGEARALNFLAQFHCEQQNYEGAVEKASEMREVLRMHGSKTTEANAARVLCEIHLTFDHPGEAVKAARDGLMLVKKAMDKWEIVEFLLLVSNATLALIGQDKSGKGMEKALRPSKEAYTIAKSLSRGKNPLMAQAMFSISSVQLISGRFDEAMAAAREALDIFRDFNDKASEATTVVHIAEIHYASGNQEKGLDAAKEGLAMAQELYNQKAIDQATALIEKMQGRPQLSFAPAGGLVGAAATAAPQADSPAGAAAPASQVAAMSNKGLDPEEVELAVQEMAKSAIGLDEAVYLDSPLMDSGMDSLTAVSFRNGLQQQLGVKLPSSLMFDYPTMKEVANRIVELSLEDA